MDLVLASTSPHRRALLARLGPPFQVVAPGTDEAAVAAGLRPEERARLLAAAKARAVAALRPGAAVIGCDQVCALGDTVLGKPATAAAAEAQLLALQGREHRLVTAVAIAHPGGLVEFADTCWLTMRALDAAAAARYVAQDQPLDCAGGYKIEARGIALFTAIHGADHTAIVGLPLMALAAALRRLGFVVP